MPKKTTRIANKLVLNIENITRLRDQILSNPNFNMAMDDNDVIRAFMDCFTKGRGPMPHVRTFHQKIDLMSDFLGLTIGDAHFLATLPTVPQHQLKKVTNKMYARILELMVDMQLSPRIAARAVFGECNEELMPHVASRTVEVA